ncbi:MAG: flagellar export chaperone FliS [Vicinamibacterales bacterium]
MTIQPGLAHYRRTQVQSSSPLELVVMLYDGALASMHAARAAIERRDVPARRDALAKVLAIVNELQSTLNMAEGGDVAAALDDLYAYVNSRLLQAAAENAVGPLDDALRVFASLRDAWATIAAAPPGRAGGTSDPMRGAA